MPTAPPTPERGAQGSGTRTLPPLTNLHYRWVSIETDGSFVTHDTLKVTDFRGKPARRWPKCLLDTVNALIDPDGTLVPSGGALTWYQTPTLGLVLRADQSHTDPIPHARNPVAERMLTEALRGAHFKVPVRGPIAWFGGFDYSLRFYLAFTKERFAALRELHQRAAQPDQS